MTLSAKFSAPTFVDPVLAELVEQFLERIEAGAAVDAESFARGHPEQAQELLRLLPTLMALADLSRAGGKAADPAQAAVEALGTLGDFRLLREVGRGGMGVVYEAVQLSLNRRVALKILPFAAALDERRLERFKLEATAAAQLHHPHIVPVFGFGSERGVHYYAMQFIDGQTLAQAIRRLRQSRQKERDAAPAIASSAAVSPAAGTAPTAALNASTLGTDDVGSAEFFRTIARLGVQAAEALDHAHALGVLHRDIKPANLLLDHRGSLWVTDLGVARLGADAGLTLTGDLPGTLRYMSPEQALGHAVPLDYRSDLYSLGATLYELLTLEPAWNGVGREQILRQIAFDEPRPVRALNAAVPTDLETIVLKAMAHEPRDRYPSARDLADDLKRYLEHRPIHARRPSFAQRVAKWLYRHQAVAALTTVFLMLAVSGLSAGLAVIVRERADANERRKEAQDAQTRAAEQAQIAQEQERIAREQARVARLHRYVADMRRAFAALESADLPELEALLSAHIPGPGQEDQRGFEWRLLWAMCHMEPRVLRGHRGEVESVAYSDDDRYVASAGKDGTVRLWNAATGQQLAELGGHRGEVHSVAFAPDNRTLAWCGDEGVIYLWDAVTRTAQRQLRPGKGEMRVVAFARDGRTLAAGAGDGSVLIWDTEQWQFYAVLEKHKRRIEAMTLSADGKWLLTGSLDGTAKIWEIPGRASTGAAPPAHIAPRRTLDPRRRDPQGRLLTLAKLVRGVAMGGDGNPVAVSMDDGSVGYWANLGTKYLHHRMPHKSCIRALARSAGGGCACGAEDGSIRLYEYRDPFNKSTLLLGHTGAVRSVAFSWNGTELASAGADGTVRLWSLRRWPESGLSPLPSDHIHGLAFSPDGSTLAGSSLDGTVWLWNPRTRVVRRVFEAPPGPLPQPTRPLNGYGFSSIDQVAFSADGRWLAASSFEGPARIWDVNSGRERCALNDAPHHQQHIAFFPDSRTVATGGVGPTITLWDLDQARPKRQLDTKELSTAALAVSTDGLRLVAGHVSGRITVWHVGTGAREAELPSGRSFCRWVAIAPDGHTLAAGNKDGTLRFWDLPTGQVRYTLASVGTHELVSGAFSPDGRTLATSDVIGSVRFWNVATGQELFALPARAVDAVAFSPDGSALAAAWPKYLQPSDLRVWTVGR